MEQNSPIFITGIERSGSSIIARIVKHCGGFTGSTTEMYENIGIKGLIDAYYKLHDYDKKGQFPLPDTKTLTIFPDWKLEVDNILKYNESAPWMLKGSRLCQTWPLWHSAFPNAKWIIVRRRTGDIIESCLKTGYMMAYKDIEGWLGWVHQHEKLFVEMIEAGLNCREIWPERMVYGDYQQVQDIINWVGLIWDEELVNIINPLLWNSKQRERSK